MAEWKDLRNYEISVWTLQDSYITTLKSGDPLFAISSESAAVWPQARAQGQIQNGQMEINIDGTQTLSFDIPMYLYRNGERVENPNWYSAVNQNVLTSMRKIKVIFDKWDTETTVNDQKVQIIECFNGANGNVNLYNRPKVYNSDGTYSTLASRTYTIGNMIVTLTAISADGQTVLYTIPAGHTFNEADYSQLDAYVAELVAKNPTSIDDLLTKDTSKLVIRAVYASESSMANETAWAYQLHNMSEIYEELYKNSDMLAANQIETYRSNGTAVFEFIILKVTETHESDNLICHVECEGLAFHELGKVGYKRSLTTEEFNNDYYEWSISAESDYPNDKYNTKEEAMPIANMQYWMKKARIKPKPVSNINPTEWYYEIRMAHTSLVHEISVISNKIYEEGFVDDWTDDGTPATFIEAREKARLVDLNESNLYNITQDLAEKFGVFCRYEYTYDNNYNIIGRTIVFYNNFLQEGKDVTTLMYPNSASKISREMDSTDVSTKMFVRSVDKEDLYHGTVNIMDCSANLSKEDYLLNFKYLYEIGTISKEQYEEIPKFELRMRELNQKITPLQDAYAHLSDLKIEVDAKVTNLTKSIELDEERITENAALIYALDTMDGDNDGFITRDYRNPEIFSLLKDSSDSQYDSYYIQLNSNDKCRGIQPGTLELYKDYANVSTQTFKYGVGYEGFSGIPEGNGMSIPNESTHEYTYKGTYGNSQASITSLPAASASNKYWVYKNISNNKAYWSNGSSWVEVGGGTAGNGIVLYKLERLQQINGPVTEVCVCERKGTTDGNKDYITRLRRLYYTAASKPSAPVNESASTSATKIYSYNILGEWTSFLSTPDDLADLTKVWRSWEATYAIAGKEFSAVDQITQDTNGTSFEDAMTNVRNAYLKSSDKIEGETKYDEYGNLDKVTGLFVRNKQGSYFSYGVLDNGISSATSSNITSVLSTLDAAATEDTFPTDRKGKYALIKEKHQYSNGNIVYSYRLKYYGLDDVPTTPTTTTMVSSIDPIFYLKTTAANPTTPTSNNVSTSVGKDKWCTGLPVYSEMEDGWVYYSGWRVTLYNDTVSYLYNSSQTPIAATAPPTTTEDENAVPKYVYGVFKYKPNWYYEKIKESWEQKLYSDNKDLQENQSRQTTLDTLIESIKDTIDMYVEEKENEIAKFEHMMGAALRESNWQPEDEYQDYGTKHQETLVLPMQHLYNEDIDTGNSATIFNNATEEQFASIGWDGIRLDEEDKLYYEYSANKTKVYYPCIDLSKLSSPISDQYSFLYKYFYWAKTEDMQKPFAFFFNPTRNEIDYNIENMSQYDIRYSNYFVIGSEAKLAFIRADSVIKPVLILTGAAKLSETELQNMYNTGRIGKLIPTKENGNIIMKMNNSSTYTIPDSAWLNVTKSNGVWVQNEPNTFKYYEIVYPRILIPSLKLKANTKDLVIKFNDVQLEEYKDYYVFTKTYYDKNGPNYGSQTISNVNYTLYDFKDLESISEDMIQKTSKIVTYYTITIKPEYLFKHINVYTAHDFTFETYYAISNADIDIYLDAKDILKENAYPKVSYEIEVSKWSPTLLAKLYTKLAQLVMINDTDLKFRDTFGYISDIKFDLDHEEKDTIEVKNYKTKFEDLFSRIVAETEEMHKNSRNIGLAGAMASGDSVDTKLSTDALAGTLNTSSNKQLLAQFLSEYFDGPEVVQSTLKDLFDEAGQILASAANSLNQVVSVTTQNASILDGFRENVAAALTPKVFTGPNPPTNFKPGDIWISDDNSRYVATGYAGRGGFTRTFDGSLAEITGASMNINADTGVIDILAETEINLKSGRDLYIAANDDVNIVGNRSVNIGGTTINMASSTIAGGGYQGEGGIHLVSSAYTYDSTSRELTEDTNSASRVDIHGNGIELASKNGIIIKSGAGIDIKSASDEAVSAVQIDKDKGVWIGSDKTVSLFSGAAGSGGASVELSADHLLLGVASGTGDSATAIEMSKEQIILAAGGNLSTIAGTTGGITATQLAGLQIKKNYIGMATGTGNNRNIFALEPGKIKLGQMSGSGDNPENYTGNFMWLDKNEIYIGGMGNLTLNTNNIKIQTKILQNQTGSGTITSGSAVQMGFALGRFLQGKDANNQNVTPDVGLGFWIDSQGARHLVVDGEIRATSFTLSSSSDYTITTTYALSTSKASAPSSGWQNSKPNTTEISTYSNNHSSATDIYIWMKVVTTLGGQSRTNYSVERVNPDGTTNTIIIDYTTSNTATVPDSPTWYSTSTDAIAARNNNKFLVTRTRTFNGNGWNPTYTFSKLVDDEVTLIYPLSIENLYYLKASSGHGAPTAPDKPTARVTSTDNESGKWTLVVPTYTGTSSTKYYYFTCTQTHWAGKTGAAEWEWSTVRLDSGLSVANQHATQASIDATAAATSVEPITTYGLAGETTWNGTQYALVLGNNQTDPMLIGSNGGITIVDTNNASGNGSAISLKSSSIGMYGSSIVFVAAGGDITSTSAVAIDKDGITLGSHNLSVSVSSTNKYFTLDTNNIGTSDAVLYMGNAQTFASATSGLQYANGSLSVKGAITATSFQLASGASGGYSQSKQWIINTTSTAYTSSNAPSSGWTNWDTTAPNLANNQGKYLHTKITSTLGGQNNVTYSVDYISKDGTNGTDGTSYTIDGLSNIFWGGTANAKDQYVGLTSTQGLLLGANNGIIVPKVAPNNNIGQADNTQTTVKIDKDGIAFDYFANPSNATASSYIHMSNHGIEVSGNRISINGDDVWARDDIVVMSSDPTHWSYTIAGAEAHMANATNDWVLIKPYYDAEINYTAGNFNDQNGRAFIFPGSFVSQQSFATISGLTYTYSFTCEIATSSSMQNNDCALYLSNTQMSTYQDVLDNDNKVTVTFTPSRFFNSTPLKVSGSVQSNVNLFGDGVTIYFVLRVAGAPSDISNCTFSDLRITGRCPSTTKRVPCTVYYYPRSNS